MFIPRRLIVPDLRLSEQRPSGTRYIERLRNISPDDEHAIRARAGTRSLRALAAEYGVSHETIRSIQLAGDRSGRSTGRSGR